MKTKKFSKKEAIKFGWDITKNNLGFFAGITIVYFILIFIPSILIEITKEQGSFLEVAFSIAHYALIVIMSMGFIKIVLLFVDNKKAKLGNLFSEYRLFFKYIFAQFLYVLIVGMGIILFIVPGIYLGVRFWFFDYFIVDKKIGPIKALKESWKATSGSAFNLFLFFLLMALINIIGVLAMGIGLFITLPTTMIATAIVYRKLLVKKSPEEMPPVIKNQL